MDEVLDAIAKMNRRNAAKSVDSFDFSALFTGLEHTLLIEVLGEVVDMAFIWHSRVERNSI